MELEKKWNRFYGALLQMYWSVKDNVKSVFMPLCWCLILQQLESWSVSQPFFHYFLITTQIYSSFTIFSSLPCFFWLTHSFFTPFFLHHTIIFRDAQPADRATLLTFHFCLSKILISNNFTKFLPAFLNCLGCFYCLVQSVQYNLIWFRFDLIPLDFSELNP